MQTFDTLEDAVRVASEVIGGKIDPHLGCSLIAEIGHKNNYLALLDQFLLLAHEQDGHEHLGITRATTLPYIIEACRELIESQA